MQFIRWLGNMINGVWHILDIDPFNIGINLNILFLGLTCFGLMISFFKRVGGMESGGFSTIYDLLNRKSDK